MKILLGLSSAVALVATTMPAFATDWQRLGANAKGTEFYYDRDSIRAGEGTILVRIRADYRGTAPTDGVAERLYLEEYDCTNRNLRLRELTTFDDSGQQLDTFTFAPGEIEWLHADTGTIGALKLDAVCPLAA